MNSRTNLLKRVSVLRECLRRLFSFEPNVRLGRLTVAIEDVEEWVDSSALLEAEMELVRLEVLYQQLNIVYWENTPAFEELRRSLLRTRTSDNFAGWRFEVHVASIFCINEIDFRKSESPDFLSQDSEHMWGIECTSARVSGPRGLNGARKKVLQKLGVKLRSPYVNSKTAVMLDTTSLIHTVTVTEGPAYIDAFREDLKALLRASGTCRAGSLLAFSHVFIKAPNADYIGQGLWGYIREDSLEIDPGLKDLLDRTFPKGMMLARLDVMPPEG